MEKKRKALSILDRAKQLADAGIAVFPCSANKRPACANGVLDASTDHKTIAALFAAAPNAALIGAAMGAVSGLLCIDLDFYKGPEAQAFYDELSAAGLLPETRVHRTPNGGEHYFYEIDGPFPSLVPSDNVDVKADGGYVCWYDDGATGEIERAPAGLLARLRAKKSDQSAESYEALKAKIFKAENFHDSLSRYAARLAGGGMDQGQVMLALLDALRGSVASSVHHERHDRWRSLMGDKDEELSRICTTAHTKYNSTAASHNLAEALFGAKAEQVAGSMFSTPNRGETEQKLIPNFSEDQWPFEGEGYFAHENHDLLKQRFVMHPIICEDEAILIAAEPKTGKTAISLTVGLHIACGINLGEGLKVAEPRSVIYFGLEGRRAIRLRIAAWRRYQTEKGAKLPDEIPLFVVEAGQNLLLPDARKLLVAKILAAEAYLKKKQSPSVGLIVLDTLTKSMPGGDQNSVEDTSSVFEIVGMLRTAKVTAAVAFIHHKARAGNVRGSTNIEADPDVLTSIEKDGPTVKWRLDRARSVEEGGSYHFTLHNYDLGISEQGFPINAPVVEATDYQTDTTNSFDEAKIANKVMSIVTGMGDGKHNLAAVIEALNKEGFGPMTDVKRGKSVVRAASEKAQTYFADLIPDTGYVFGGKSVTRVTEGGMITALFIR